MFSEFIDDGSKTNLESLRAGLEFMHSIARDLQHTFEVAIIAQRRYADFEAMVEVGVNGNLYSRRKNLTLSYKDGRLVASTGVWEHHIEMLGLKLEGEYQVATLVGNIPAFVRTRVVACSGAGRTISFEFDVEKGNKNALSYIVKLMRANGMKLRLDGAK